jgi:hypothetical protein
MCEDTAGARAFAGHFLDVYTKNTGLEALFDPEIKACRQILRKPDGKPPPRRSRSPRVRVSENPIPVDIPPAELRFFAGQLLQQTWDILRRYQTAFGV